MRAAVLAICFAGCSHPEGVAIEVHPGATSADTVELFIGRTACRDPDCGGIEPPGIFGKLPGTVAYRDGDEVDSAPMVDGVVTFQLRPDKGSETLPLVIAVGFSNGDPDSVAIIRDLEVSSEPQLVYATLSGATSHVRSVPANSSIPDGDRVEVWREKNAPMSSCVVVQRWRNNQPEHLFVVPTDDPDCDDVPNGPLECNQYVFHASTAPKDLGHDNCLARFPDMGEPICRLGGPGCTDGVGTTQCAPSPFCLPDVVCDAGTTACTPRTSPICIDMQLANISAITRVECEVPTDLGQPCMNMLPVTIDFGPVFDPAMATCTDISFDTLTDMQLAFQPTLQFANGFQLIPMSPQPQPSCSLDVMWMGPVPAGQTEANRGLMQISVDNGQHIIIPINIEYLPNQCGTAAFKCTVDFGTNGTTGGMDSVWNCVD